MYVDFGIGSYRFNFSIRKHVKCLGIVSDIGDGKHFLIWDFDNASQSEVTTALQSVQERFGLSTVYVVSSGDTESYHAYCFKSFYWADAVHVIMATPFVDRGYCKIGVMRGYFDVRFTPKEGRSFKHVCQLPSDVAPDVNPYTLNKVIQYWTAAKGDKRG